MREVEIKPPEEEEGVIKKDEKTEGECNCCFCTTCCVAGIAYSSTLPNVGKLVQD
jgi:hypothetical protein